MSHYQWSYRKERLADSFTSYINKLNVCVVSGKEADLATSMV